MSTKLGSHGGMVLMQIYLRFCQFLNQGQMKFILLFYISENNGHRGRCFSPNMAGVDNKLHILDGNIGILQL